MCSRNLSTFQPLRATPTTGTSSSPRCTIASNAGKIFLPARSPVAPNRTNASACALLIVQLLRESRRGSRGLPTASIRSRRSVMSTSLPVAQRAVGSVRHVQTQADVAGRNVGDLLPAVHPIVHDRRRRAGKRAAVGRAARSSAGKRRVQIDGRTSGRRPPIALPDGLRAVARTSERATHGELDEFRVRPDQRHRRAAGLARVETALRNRIGIPHLLRDQTGASGHRRHRPPGYGSGSLPAASS